MILAPASLALGATFRSPAVLSPATSQSPSSGGATNAGQGGGNPTVDPDHWASWWGYNRQPLLDLKRFVHSGAAGTLGEEFFLGRGEKYRQPASSRPSDLQLYDAVVPALIHALQTDRFDEVQSAALIALAKIGDRPDEERALGDIIEPFLKHSSEQVSEAAALALGILADENHAMLLVDLLHDAPPGRRALGESEVPLRTRAFAAYGLGLVAYRSDRDEVRRYVVLELAKALAETGGATQDVEIACVLALGLVALPETGDPVPLSGRQDWPPASRSLSGQIRVLADIYADRSRDVLVRAHAPVSMARLAASGSDELRAEVAELVLPSLAKHARTRRETLQGGVIALGLIGDTDADDVDQHIRRELMRVADEADPLTRSLAIMALGRLASRPVTGDPSGLESVRSFLLEKLAHESGIRRPWAGLSLAVLERGLADAGRPISNDVQAALRHALERATSIDEAGGLCLALGLIQASPAASDLLDLLDRWDEDYARSNAAIGLGLMHADQAIEPLREVMSESKFRPELVRSVAISLALLKDTGAVPQLIAMLHESKSLSSQAAVATALGSIGDRRSVDALLMLIQDPEVSSLARAFAIAGLGIVGDKEPLPWNSKLAVDVNYNALTESLTDPATGRGVLDIL